ncbi:type III toxin-antitoxin system ToxN/AbiQ family toxin [Robertmurraya beringensis]|uniref:Type III toxin-antitoxin system ToxN/AbiQ family toxin n=1 Tax=Robertmurraya beringensis TaxID=641660 RepID=A0ABV6KQN9_9BACI
MNNYKIYSVSDRYITYLRKQVPGVYSNKVDIRTHTRKYIGVVYSINGYNYYIPLSSPKNTDYKIIGGKKVIRKSIVPIMRITEKNSDGVIELKGTLRISHMIPVPSTELTLYDLNNEADLEYKDLVQKEIIFIRKNKNKIKNNVELIYKQKINNDETANYVKTALDYKLLEEVCDQFNKVFITN